MKNKDLCKSCQYNTGEYFLYCELQCYGVTKTDGHGIVWECDDYLQRQTTTNGTPSSSASRLHSRNPRARSWRRGTTRQNRNTSTRPGNNQYTTKNTTKPRTTQAPADTHRTKKPTLWVYHR